jgi:hypothetical protein
MSGATKLRAYIESDADDEVADEDLEAADAGNTDDNPEKARRDNQFYKTQLHRDVQGNLVRLKRYAKDVSLRSVSIILTSMHCYKAGIEEIIKMIQT